MRQKTLLSSLLLSSILSVSLLADDWDAQDPCGLCCEMTPRPMRLSARHIEGKGVGYNQGYTTLEAFISPVYPRRENWIPFLDLRAHVFNNSKWAANAGAGARYITSSRAWGGNFYYDYRRTSQNHYNQVSLGFESLGEMWDFRINGYIPVGKTQSSLSHVHFAKFGGHSAFISGKQEVALKGANAEVGAHVNSDENALLYLAAGPYYLDGHGKTAWGGEFRAAIDFGAYIRLEGNTSYDSLFHWIGQGQISLNLPFGAKRNVRKNGNCCSTAHALSQRAVQRVDRNEIIAIKDKHTVKKLSPNFIFVDNTSHSDGTWESPYPTLDLAQNNSQPGDIIYVLPGNGSAYDVTALGGFVMQSEQKLWGSSIEHELSTTFGTITIPAMSAAMPKVLGNSITSVVSAGNNGEVAGINILGNSVGNGILALNASVLIEKNVISLNNGVSVGISLQSKGSSLITASILNNQISCTGLGIDGILAETQNSSSMTVLIQNNELSNIICSTIQAIGISNINLGTGSLTANILNNQISDVKSTGAGTPRGISLTNTVGGTLTANILNNEISTITSAGAGQPTGIFLTSAGSGILTANISNNDIAQIEGNLTSSAGGITGFSSASGSMVASIQNNQISHLAAPAGQATGIGLTSNSTGSYTASTQNNHISNITGNTTCAGIALASLAAGSSTFTTVGNQISTISSSSGTGILALNNGTGNKIFSILDNQISNITASANGIGISANSSAGNVRLLIQDNQVSTLAPAPTTLGIDVPITGGSTCLTLIGNNTATYPITVSQTAGTFTLDISSGDNTPAPSLSGTITSGSCSP